MLFRIYIGGLTSNMIADLDVETVRFGGYTRFEAVGGWRDGDNVVKERVVVYEIVSADTAEVKRFALKAKTMARQKAVLVVSTQCESEMV